ncbi:MAG: RDD family protein, partial [Candidatus Tectomicrobia bacterium]|nr:RDD family protein [Candidatus Tectomicrobia bacterium]
AEEPAEAAAAGTPSLDELTEGMEGLEEFALPEEEPPAARAPGAGRPHPRRQERPKAPAPAPAAPEEGDDLLASLDLDESLDLEKAPAAKEAAAPPGGGAAISPDVVSEEDLLSFEAAETPSPAPSRAAPVEVKGAAGEEDKELDQFLALDVREESPTAAAGARTAPAASPEDEDLLSLLDEADEAAPAAPPREPPRAGAPREESTEDLLLEETEAGKEVSAAVPAPVPSAQGKAAGKDEGEDDVSSLWADAFTEEQAAPPSAASKGLLDEDAEEAGAPRPADEGEGDDPSSAWAGALGEKEGAPAPGKKEVTPPVGASAGAGDDSLSDMWSEAFAEQEAAARAQREEQEPQARPQAAAAAGEFGEGDLERMWSDALNETGDAPAPRAGAAAAPAGPLPGAEEGLSKEDLAGFLDEAEAAPAPSGAALAEGGAAPPAEEEAAPRPRGGGGFGVEEDSDEIEAYVPEEAPVAAAAVAEAEPKAGGEDFLDDAGAPPEEPEKEEQAEVIGVPLASRFVAGAVDFGVLAVLQGFFSWISIGIVSKVAGPVTSNMEALILLGVLNLAVLFLLSIFYSVYFVGMFGCTPGQRSMGLLSR